MAFVSRAERKLMIYQNSTSLGPGSYLGLARYKDVKNKAPFSSSSEKSVKDHKTCTPGPGSYVGVGVNFIENSKSSSFASQIDRFHLKKEEIPGPGSYNISKPWKIARVHSPYHDSINWERLPSAPSIPNNSILYLSNEKGELLKSAVLDKNEANLGPGYYDPVYTTSAKCCKWPKPQKTKSGFSKIYSPGPGTYNLTPTEPKYKTKSKNAVFLSKSKRTYRNEKDGPGPGMYSVISGFSPNLYLKNQRFGSKCERFRSATPDPYFPGPGSYTPQGVKPSDQKSCFQSSRPRFSEQARDSPGPGYYNLEEPKRPVSHFGAFGATEKRFVMENNSNPGPGTYSVKKVGNNSVKAKGLSTFLSKCKRLTPAVQDSTPAPGAYEISSAIGTEKKVKSAINPVLIKGSPKAKPFNTQSQRFQEDLNKIPGPGSYSTEGKRPCKTVALYKHPRFKYSYSASPGPGSYRNQDEWNKKSYNAIFDYK